MFISNRLHGKNYWITQFVNQMKTSIWLTNWVITKFGFLEAVWRPFEIKDFGQLHLLHLARTQLFSLTPFFLSSTASTGKFFELLSSSTSPWLTNWVITKFSFLGAAWRPFKIEFFPFSIYCFLPGLNFFAKHKKFYLQRPPREKFLNYSVRQPALILREFI